jgi:transglutaminase-like putative cysteine protease
VFWNFDGQSWKSSFFSRNLLAESRPDPENAQYRYRLQMEPTEQRWLFALDYPALIPKDALLTIDYQLLARQPVTQLRDFVMASDPNFIDSPNLRQTLRNTALSLPADFNPRTAEMMSSWRKQAGNDTEIIQRALNFFNQQGFRYTLNPPLLSRHTVDDFLFNTQQGFCEHYASAFTVMMRMAGIPARVVTGYLGGWYNNIGSYLLVRQSDAHAWSEVWVRGSGWTRIDPTAAVAPSRVDRGSMESLAERRYMLDFVWLRHARNAFDLFQRGWNNWVVAFGSAKQSRLLSVFGWGSLDSARLVLIMIVTLMAIGAVIFLAAPLLLKLRAFQKQDPVLRSWYKFIRKLDKAGFISRPSMGPMELAASAGGQLKCSADGIMQIAELYMRCRYSREAGDRAELAQLIDRFQPRPLSQ